MSAAVQAYEAFRQTVEAVCLWGIGVLALALCAVGLGRFARDVRRLGLVGVVAFGLLVIATWRVSATKTNDVPTARPESSPYRVLVPTARPESSPYRVLLGAPAPLERIEDWWLCGAWEDSLPFAFEDGWVFPFGDGHLSSVEIDSQGGLFTNARMTNLVCQLPVSLALVPGDTEVRCGPTSSNSYAFVWTRGHPNRLADATMDGRIELEAVYAAPANPCVHRHTFGVGEKVRFLHYPEDATVQFESISDIGRELSVYYNTFNGLMSDLDKSRINVCPISAGTMPLPRVSRDVWNSYIPTLTIVEPSEVITPVASYECHLESGEAGPGLLITTNYIGPMTVSFKGVMLAEIPCTNAVPPTGYFATSDFHGHLTHTYDAGAGNARRIRDGNLWCEDKAGRDATYPNWSPGRLEWNIPIGWFRLRNDAENESDLIIECDHEVEADKSSRPLLIGDRIDCYKQIFTIESDGTCRIDKFGHSLSRKPNGRITLDGTVQ